MPLNDSNSTDLSDNTIVVLADKDDPSRRAKVDSSGNVSVTNAELISIDAKTRNINLSTYSGSSVAFVPPGSATDIFMITGSASKIIKIHKIKITMTTTSGSAVKATFSLIKRSTLNTGGTSVLGTVVPNDSLDPAGTAIFRHYTANPTLGTSVGTVRADTVAVTGSGVTGGEVKWEFDTIKPLTLRGAAQCLCINLGGISVAGPIASVSVEWTEE